MNIKSIDLNDVHILSSLQPKGWSEISPIFKFYSKSSFCFPIKTTIDNKIVGIGTTVIHDDVAWLAHIIVDSAYRRRGIGLQIVKALMEIAEENYCSTIYLIATELGVPIYEKVGFVTEAKYLVHKHVTKNDWIISDNIYPYVDEYKEQIKTLDKSVSGENRMIHLEEHCKNCQIYCSNDIVEGYYMPTLGEGLIIANTEKAGIELLKLHLKGNDQVVVPQENHIACKFLEEIGVGEMRVIRRMRFGKERKVQFPHIYNRIGGNVG